MIKKNVPNLIIFAIVIIVILFAPYLIRIFGFASSVNIGSTVCFGGPYYVDPKPNPTQEAHEGQAYSVDFYFKETDAINDLTFSTDPSWFSISTQQDSNNSNNTIATLSFTPNIAQVGVTTVTVTASLAGVCHKNVDFTLIVFGSPTAPIAGGGGGGGAREEVVYGGCQRDSDCPEGFYCSVDDVCVQEIPAELEELPEIIVPEEKEELFIIHPKEAEEMFNREIIEYPSPGVIDAIRKGLVKSTGMIDWSLYNPYYEPKETALGVYLRERPALKQFTLVLLTLFVVGSAILIFIKSRKPVIYIPPEIE